MNPLFAAWVCWAIVGASPIVGKFAVGLINPALLVLGGTLLGILFFVPWITQHTKWGELFAKETLVKFLLIGTFGTALPFTISLIALHYTTAGNAAILQQSELIYSLIFAIVFLKEFPKKNQLLGSAMIVIGVLIILFKEQYSPQWTGDLLIVGSTWMLQAGSTIAKKLPKHLDYRVIAMARNLFALPALVVIVIVMWHLQGGLTVSWSIKSVGILGYTGIFKYGLAMVVWYKAIRSLDLSKVTAIYLSYPVLSLVLSSLLGLEKIQPHQIIGLVISCLGAYLISVSVRREGH